MVANPLVSQVPVMIGGDGKEELHEFYAKYFAPHYGWSAARTLPP